MNRALALALALTASCAGSPSLGSTPLWRESPEERPVIDRGPAGAWDHYAVDNPTVFVEGGVFYCFYEAQDKPFNQGGHERAGLAISRDGLLWEKWKDNPILDVGPAGSWDSRMAKLPIVTRHEGRYYLFYSGRDARTKNIGLATSTDLRHWTKHPGNPVLRGRPDQWDRQLSTHPAPVVRRDDRFYLLYRGMQTFYKQQALGVAVSTDLVHWTRAQDGPVIGAEHEVASFAMAPLDGRFLGMVQSAGRPCWESTDLLHWTKSGQATFTAAIVDTVSNPFPTPAGWTVLYEQKDRIYRALLQ